VIFSFNDIEFAFLLILEVSLFLLGLKRRDAVLDGKYTGIDLPMSTALKGIACILILMGHFVTHRELAVDTTRFSRLIQYTTANIALAIFMYFSGYGLSLKKVSGGGVSSIWIKRLKKVYLPLLFTSIIAMVIYSILPVASEDGDVLKLPKDIFYLHNFETDYLTILIPHLLGWKDWYVFCIMFFYSLFYFSLSVTRNNPENQTWVLWLFLLGYYVFAYFYFGPPEAHWYRYCWAFFCGHVHAKMVKSGRINKWDAIMFAVLFASIFIEGLDMQLSYLIALAIIIICARLNRKFLMQSKSLAMLGGISYFFYLSHVRIVFATFTTYNLYSVLLWVVAAIIVSLILKRMYEAIIAVLHF